MKRALILEDRMIDTIMWALSLAGAVDKNPVFRTSIADKIGKCGPNEPYRGERLIEESRKLAHDLDANIHPIILEPQ